MSSRQHSAALACLFALAGAAVFAAPDGNLPPPRRVKVAVISFIPVKLDLAANAARLEMAFSRAAETGAKLAVAPEGILEGYVINPMLAGEIPLERMRDVALPIDHPIIRRFQAIAKSLQLCVVFGFAEKVGDDVFNTAVFIDHTGEIRGKYHKMQLEEGYHPDWWFNRLGTESRAFDTPFGRCGILICNDRWNAALAKIPALDGAQFLVIPSYGSTGRAQDDAVLSRARETGLPIVEANVGVTLVVNAGEIAAVSRDQNTIMFSEITIPAPSASRPTERDAVERAFLQWRAEEMPRRFQAKNHRAGTNGSAGAAK